MHDDDELPPDFLTPEQIQYLRDNPLTQERFNAAARRLAEKGVVEWNEETLEVRLTPNGVAEVERQLATKALRKKMN